MKGAPMKTLLAKISTLRRALSIIYDWIWNGTTYSAISREPTLEVLDQTAKDIGDKAGIVHALLVSLRRELAIEFALARLGYKSADRANEAAERILAIVEETLATVNGWEPEKTSVVLPAIIAATNRAHEVARQLYKAPHLLSD